MSQILLIAGGIMSLAIAILHVIIIAYGAPAYRYFGAGEKMAIMAEEGSKIPALVTWCVTFGFVGFGAYAFAAAGIFSGLPLIFWGAFAVSAVYTLRGLGLFAVLAMPNKATRFDVVSSVISLGIGLVHFAGLYWNNVFVS